MSQLVEPGTTAYVGMAGLLALVVGVVRVAIGAVGLGAVAYAMSHPVIAGFVPAAGLVIAVGQLPSMVGVEVGGRGTLQATAAVVDVSQWDPAAVGLAELPAGLLRVVGPTPRKILARVLDDPGSRGPRTSQSRAPATGVQTRLEQTLVIV